MVQRPTAASFCSLLTYVQTHLLSADGKTFEAQENSFFDYKDQFPFSFSDEYFLGISKLICAFYNTFGGFIIFGVHDKLRTPGHNKVKINIERLNNTLRSKLSGSIECIHVALNLPAHEEEGKIDVILVPKRPQITPPVRFVKEEGRFRPAQIFLRRGHEVLEAKSADLPFLYGPRLDPELSDENEPPIQPIQVVLPPSPATMRTFVGRLFTLERLWAWLFSDDEPRVFLYGKGGTGKSTLAFEFARLVSQNGANSRTSSGRALDRIIYLSAKKREVLPATAEVLETKHRDFSNSGELFKSILYYSEWIQDTVDSPMDDNELEGQLRDRSCAVRASRFVSMRGMRIAGRALRSASLACGRGTVRRARPSRALSGSQPSCRGGRGGRAGACAAWRPGLPATSAGSRISNLVSSVSLSQA